MTLDTTLQATTISVFNISTAKNLSAHWPGKRLGWPNALALDPPSKRLFWADAKEDYIASCNYDGGQPRLGTYNIFFASTPNIIKHMIALEFDVLLQEYTIRLACTVCIFTICNALQCHLI